MGTRFGPSPVGTVLPAAQVSSVRGLASISASSVPLKLSVPASSLEPLPPIQLELMTSAGREPAPAGTPVMNAARYGPNVEMPLKLTKERRREGPVVWPTGGDRAGSELGVGRHAALILARIRCRRAGRP